MQRYSLSNLTNETIKHKGEKKMTNEKNEELEKIRNNKVNKQITKVVEQYGYKVSRCFFHPSYNVEADRKSVV